MIDNKLLLPDGNTIIFNDEQYNGLFKIINNWIPERHTKPFTLSGFAGTGKTLLTKKIIESYNRSLVVSAPTHKAKKVIMRVTESQGETLQALLGLRPNVDLDSFNPNNPTFSPIAKPKIYKYKFAIIDEASMINEDLMLLITTLADRFKTKILYVGDPAQIPPIGEKLSAVFSGNDLVNLHQLTIVERQLNGNPIGPYYDKLRNNLQLEDGGFKRISDVNEKNEGVVFTARKGEFRKHILEKFSSSDFKKDIEFMKLIAWRNDTVIQSNQTIRQNILGDDVDIVEVDDILMGYRTISNEYMKNIVENSTEYKIVDKLNKQLNKYEISGYPIKIMEEYNDQLLYNEIFIVDHTNNDNLHRYAEMHDFLKERAKANKKEWKTYYSFRRNNVIMKTIKNFKDKTLREFDEVIAKDMDYGYAITCHKAQGSTYKHVAVLEDDIDVNPKIRERNQIKYVAMTRPQTSCNVLTSRVKKNKYF